MCDFDLYLSPLNHSLIIAGTFPLQRTLCPCQSPRLEAGTIWDLSRAGGGGLGAGQRSVWHEWYFCTLSLFSQKGRLVMTNKAINPALLLKTTQHILFWQPVLLCYLWGFGIKGFLGFFNDCMITWAGHCYYCLQSTSRKSEWEQLCFKTLCWFCPLEGSIMAFCSSVFICIDIHVVRMLSVICIDLHVVWMLRVCLLIQVNEMEV